MDDDATWSAFQKRMKNATKKVHDLQDIAINGLFVLSLYTGGATELWYQALSRFEFVFAELEDALESCGELEDFDIPGIRISEIMKNDLDQFYGKDRDRSHSSAIKTWISEVRKTRKENPTLMVAYIYHMYLGLYSGGRILRHKFKLPGETLDLSDRAINISKALKTAMRNLVLSRPDLSDGLILHSQNVFKLNNLIIHECDIYKARLFKIFATFGLCVGGAFLAKRLQLF